jgi:hypothetical protein
MAIRKRFEDVVQLTEDEYKAEQAGHKFTIDPGKDPFPGSTADNMGIPREMARSVLGAFAYMYKPQLPSQMATQDLLAQLRLSDNPDPTEQRYRDRIRSPLTGIRAFCVTCQGGSPKAVGQCDVVSCPLWPFRLGQNSFYGRK